MINKFNLMIVLFLIISFPIASALSSGEGPQVATPASPVVTLPPAEAAYDSDGDSVCDEASTKLGFIGRRYGVDCTATRVGDLCANTPKYERAYTDDERSGCSESQLAGINNYWSVKIDTDEQRPTRVNLNWLTDQYTGVDVYVPVIFERNPDFRSEVIEFGWASFTCTSEKNYGIYEQSYYNIEFNKNANEKKYTLRLHLRRLNEEEAKNNNVFDEGLIGLKKLLGPNFNRDRDVLAAVKLDCVSTITQVKLKEERDEKGNIIYDKNNKPKQINIRPVIPHEQDRFEILIPLERLAIQPPDAALQRGIDFTESLVDKINKLIPSLEKARKITLLGCIYSVGLVLTFKIASAFGWDQLNSVADYIWKGPEKFRTGLTQGFNQGSFFISGKAMCGYSVCPASWCRYLQQNTSEMIQIKDEKGNIKEERAKTRLEQLNDRSNLWLPKGIPKRDITPQDSLFLSVACGCVSGIELNLLRIRAIAQEWNKCLRIAKTTSVYTSYCDKELNKNICKYIVGELKTFYGVDMISDIFKWIWKNTGRVFWEEKSTEKEVSDITREHGNTKQALRESTEEGWGRTKNFLETELKDIGTGQAGGNMGYFSDASEEMMLCEAAIYWRLPQLDVFERFGLDKTAWQTTIAGEWKSEAAYRAEDNRIIRSYSISWTIIAGSDNFRYTVYLSNDAGARRILEDKVLLKPGDLAANYIEITDDLDYSLLCVDVPKEIYRTRCFPPGGFAEGGPLETYKDQWEDDSDRDRLPDKWEKKYSCYEERTKLEVGKGEGFENTQDKEDCENLLKQQTNLVEQLRGNKLDPNKDDSDNDGIKDWQENPDKDLYTNYDEFEKDYNPNVADKDSKGDIVTHKCWVDSIGNIILDGGVEYGGVMKYEPGDNVGIRVDGFKLGTGTGASAQLDDVKAKVEITGPNAYYKLLGRKSISEIKNGIDWKILQTLGPSNGVYNIIINYETKSGTFAYEPCVKTGTRGETVETKRKILIYDKGSGACVDSDEGMVYTIKGICIDTNNKIIPDKCEDNNLMEYYCEDNSCTEKSVICKRGSCSNGVCSEGI